MADSKANSLTKRVFSSLSNITGVRLWSQKDGETDALGLELSELLSSEIVEEEESITYKALTPRGFRNSQQTTARNGISRASTEAEVIAKATPTALLSSDQTIMQTQWKKDFFEKSGVPNTYRADSLTNPTGMQFVCNISTDITAGGVYHISPSIPSGLKIRYASIQYAASLMNTFPNAGFTTLKYSGVEVYSPIVSIAAVSKVYVALEAAGSRLYIHSQATGNVKFSATINMVIF